MLKDNALRAAYLAVITAAISHPTASGEGFRNPPPGAFSLARAGGRIAQIDDPGAAHHNPANIIDVPGTQIQLAPTFVHVTVEYENGVDAETKDPFKVLPNFFFTTPMVENVMAFGVAVTTPFGLSNEWKKEGKFANRNPFDPAGWRYYTPWYTELKTINANPSLSWHLTDWLNFGMGVDLIWSEVTFKQFYPGIALGLPNDPSFRARADGIAFGGNAGVTIKLPHRQRIAVTYRSPFTVDYEGSLNVGEEAGAILPSGRESDFRTEVEFPTIIGVGYGIELGDRFRIETDFEWIEFSNFDTLPLDFGEYGFLLPVTELRQNWKNTFTLGIGGDYKIDESWTIRAGYQFYESPVRANYFYPTIPDSNQHVITGGLNFSRGHHSAEVAYGYVSYEGQEVTDNIDRRFNGNYDMWVHLWALSYTYRF
jgi:long-chain fatty acid transport protein